MGGLYEKSWGSIDHAAETERGGLLVSAPGPEMQLGEIAAAYYETLPSMKPPSPYCLLHDPPPYPHRPPSALLGGGKVWLVELLGLDCIYGNKLPISNFMSLAVK